MTTSEQRQIGEVLSSIFEKCEKDPTGHVEIRKLLHVLSADYGASRDITEAIECKLKSAGLLEKVNKADFESYIVQSGSSDCLTFDASSEIEGLSSAVELQEFSDNVRHSVPGFVSPSSSSESKLSFLKKAASSLEDKLNKSESIITLLEEQVSESVAENDSLKKHNERLTKEVNRLKFVEEKLAEVQSSHANARAQYEKALHDLNRSRRRASVLEKDSISKEDENKFLQEEIAKKASLVDEKGKVISTLSSNLEAVSEQNSRYCQQLKELRQQLENERETVNCLAERIRELSTDKVHLQMQLNEIATYEHAMHRSSTAVTVSPTFGDCACCSQNPEQSLLNELSAAQRVPSFLNNNKDINEPTSLSYMGTQTDSCGTGWSLCKLENRHSTPGKEWSSDLHTLETTFRERVKSLSDLQESPYDRFHKKLLLIALLGGVVLVAVHVIASLWHGPCWKYSQLFRTRTGSPPI